MVPNVIDVAWAESCPDVLREMQVLALPQMVLCRRHPVAAMSYCSLILEKVT
jgi:hypothetical protein